MSDIKFLVTGDLHWTGKNPKARIDSYIGSLKQKLMEIQTYAEGYLCSGIIIPGDIFDSPGVSYSVLVELVNIIRRSKIPVYTIAGNHDLYSGNPNTQLRTPYGLLSSSRLINDINNTGRYIELHTHLMGRSWDAKITDQNIEYYTFENKYPYPVTNKKVRVLVTHGMLLDKAPGYDLRHTLMSEVAEHPNAPDVLINGHEHNGFGIKKINNTLFINPGSIGRIKATEENINRIPQVALLTIPEDREPYAELIPLKSAKPGIEVLSREHIIEEKKRKEMTKEFLELLAEEGDNRYQDLEEIVKGIGKRKNIPPNVVKEALNRLEEAREEGHNEQRKTG